MASFGSQIVELLPHYLVMIALVFGTLFGVQAVYGELGFWPSLVVAVAVAAVYPLVVRRLGVAPGAWER